MENKLEIFKNNEFGEVRVLDQNGEPWFIGQDVANILGYKNGSRDINRHVDEEDRQNYQNGTLETNRGMTIINESGLYSLILSSKLKSAKKFKKWVTRDVLPKIRKHGMYATDELIDNPDFAIKVLEQLKLEREEKLKLQISIKENEPKVLFADSVSASSTSILVGELAKLIKQNGHEIGQNRLFQWLRDNSYLISRNGTDYNMPTQKSMELGLFEIKETSITHSDGHISINKTPKVTGKGQVYFINKFANES